MTESEARVLVERALALSSAENAVVKVSGGTQAATRFANNAVTQNMAKTAVTLDVESAFGQRVGAARTNQFDQDSLVAAVRKSEEIARVSEPDPEYMPPVEPCSYPTVLAWDDRVASASPEDRAAAASAAIDRAEAAGLTAAGSYATDAEFMALGNLRGLFAYHRWTSARYVCTAMGPDSSGWAESASWTADRVDPAAAAERAIAKALAGRCPADAAPGLYTVVLEPVAVSEMLEFMAWSMDAKEADEGTSAFMGKLGAGVAGTGITVSSQPDHPACPGAPFADDGMPSSTVDWVRDGLVANLATSRYWAQHTGRAYTGFPSNLLMQGGAGGLDDLVAGTSDGILVTRFWYIRFVDPMKLLLTGMTRDGLFRIRDGEIVGGLRNLRFNDSPLRMLANTVEIGTPVPAGTYLPALIPALKVDGFTFTSGTAF